MPYVGTDGTGLDWTEQDWTGLVRMKLKRDVGEELLAADVPEVVLKSLFRKYDTDDSKSLGKREMLTLLKEDLGFEDDRAQACILMVDKDGCGEISFGEFILWIRTEKGSEI